MAKRVKAQSSGTNIHIGAFFGRFHAVIFTVVVGGGLAVAVYLLMNILNSSDVPEDYTPQTANTSFDQQTIDHIEQLRPLSEQPASPDPTEGRTSPLAQ